MSKSKVTPLFRQSLMGVLLKISSEDVSFRISKDKRLFKECLPVFSFCSNVQTWPHWFLHSKIISSFFICPSGFEHTQLPQAHFLWKRTQGLWPQLMSAPKWAERGMMAFLKITSSGAKINYSVIYPVITQWPHLRQVGWADSPLFLTSNINQKTGTVCERLLLGTLQAFLWQ